MQKKTVQAGKRKLPNFRELVHNHAMTVICGVIITTSGVIYGGFKAYISVFKMELVQKELYILKSDINRDYIAKDEHDKLLKQNQELRILVAKREIEYQKAIKEEIASINDQIQGQTVQIRNYLNNPIVVMAGKNLQKKLTVEQKL